MWPTVSVRFVFSFRHGHMQHGPSDKGHGDEDDQERRDDEDGDGHQISLDGTKAG